MSELNFPLIISTAGSQSAIQWYSDHLKIPQEQIKLYPELVAEHLGGFCINVSQAGANNRRRIRRALYECIKQLETNPTQKTIVLLEMSLDLRKEVWIDSDGTEENLDPAESNFYGISLADEPDWWERILSGQQKKATTDIVTGKVLNATQQKYIEKWQHGNQFFYSPTAETINLYMDIVMFIGFMKYHNIDYLIFRGCPIDTEINDHLLETFADVLAQDSKVLDLSNFSLTQWCLDRNYEPVDYKDQPLLGHPSLEAHRAFALFLSEKLKNR
jgi:hypothetical protein